MVVGTGQSCSCVTHFCLDAAVLWECFICLYVSCSNQKRYVIYVFVARGTDLAQKCTNYWTSYQTCLPPALSGVFSAFFFLLRNSAAQSETPHFEFPNSVFSQVPIVQCISLTWVGRKQRLNFSQRGLTIAPIRSLPARCGWHVSFESTASGQLVRWTHYRSLVFKIFLFFKDGVFRKARLRDWRQWRWGNTSKTCNEKKTCFCCPFTEI